MHTTRRQWLLQSLFGTGMIGLRSLATGLPISFLLNPRKALADAGVEGGASPYRPQYLIFNTSEQGDPLNVNAPGTYNVPGVSTSKQPYHPTGVDPASGLSFDAVPVALGATTYQAAGPWKLLEPYNPCVFHHGTYTVVHPDERRVLGLMGETKTGDMLVSLLASQLGPALQTIQNQPVSLGSAGSAETLVYQGAPQANLTPSTLRATLTSAAGPLEQLQAMRDSDLDAINKWASNEGNAAQKAFIDKYASSQTQARQISQSLLNNLSQISGNTVTDQINAALVLIQMNVTPVVAVHIPFGGDNHSDPGYANEMSQTVSGLQSIAYLQQQLATTKMPNGTPLRELVSFASLNVFGRNLIPPGKTDGRAHLGNHHCSVLLGPAFKGSVIGGVEPFAGDYRAQAIKPSDGTGVNEGDAAAPSGTVQFTDTLAAMSLTLSHGVGVSSDFMNTNITPSVANGGTAQVIPQRL